MIHVRNRDCQEQIWAEFTRSKSAILYYADNGRNVKFTGLIAGICEIYEGEISFFAGYMEEDGSLADNCNIPEEVFAAWFPEFAEVEWNSSESSHNMEIPEGFTAETIESYLEGKFVSLGFKWDNV